MAACPKLVYGRVAHRRLRPAGNAFAYPVFYVQLPLDELAAAEGPLFGIDRFRALSFHQKDHGPRDGSPLAPWIRALLRARGLPDDGEIILQAFPRVWGYAFNPVSFWFCRDGAGALVAVLAEVNNTFGGHHHYLLHSPDGAPIGDGRTLGAEKRFHVSPFCAVEGGYRFRFWLERATTAVRIDYDDAEGALLLTSISGRPQPWSTRGLLIALLRMPLLTAGVMARIHWQALRLWLKGVPFYGKTPPRTLSRDSQGADP
ncbi:MAG: DUF1365 domain-containing protein [Candidatus Competibacteraceae bacterium]|nr:DUF1365 domain-containing protein [Candidatus Competibacteraceae bacterium]